MPAAQLIRWPEGTVPVLRGRIRTGEGIARSAGSIGDNVQTPVIHVIKLRQVEVSMGGGRAAWRRARTALSRPFGLLVASVLIVGGIASALLVHAQAARGEAARASMLFVETFSERHQLLQRGLYAMGEELHQMASLFETQMAVGREQFRAFAAEAVSTYPQIYACEWAPRVAGFDRGEHERLARLDGLDGYRIVSRGAGGGLVPVPPGSVHYPVFYAEPEEPNRAALGLDLLSEPVRAATLARALETGRLAVSDPIDLVQQGSKAILAVLPVASPGGETAGTPGESDAGVVLLVIRAQDLLDTLRLRASSDVARMRFRLVDTDVDRSAMTFAASLEWQQSALAPPEWERAIDIGGQRWLLAAQPTEAFLAPHRTRQPLVLTVGAFLFWCTAAGLLLALSKRAHDAARRDRDRVVSAALSSLTEGVVVAGADGRFLLFNEAAERLLGIGPLEMDPSEWSARYGCFRPDTVTPFPAAELPLARALRGETSQEVEVFIQNPKVPDGVWISINGAPLVERAGDRPGGGVVTFRDITARKTTEAALHHSNEQRVRHEEMVRRLYNAVEQTADSVFITTREGIIEYVNRAFETTTGYSREEVLGQTPRVLKSGHYGPDHYRGLWKTILAGEVYRATNINRRKNGEEYYAEQTITPMVDPRGEVTHFVSVVKDMTERISQQKREIEMEYASRVQQQLYPKWAPKLDEFDIAGAVFPADETGGDYFDYVLMPDDCLAVAIGDVCGHGLGSALIMAETRAYVRSLASTCSDPGMILSRINPLLLEHLAGDRQYVTLLLARLDGSARRLAYASAGHTDGFVLSQAGEVRAVLGSTGIPLGMFPDVCYASRDDVALEPDDVVVLLTDGITEAEAPDGRVFTTEAALDVVRAHRAEPARAILQSLRDAVQDFTVGQPQRDDVTIVICKVQPSPSHEVMTS
jgi:PAS domain S-box-containing protein